MTHDLLVLMSATPSPGPTPSNNGGSGTDPFVYVVPIAVAVVGLLGLAVAAWIASRSAIRVRIVDMLREEGDIARGFQIRTVASVNELLIAMGQVQLSSQALLDAALADARARGAAANATVVNVSVQVAHDGEQLERVRRATTEWRAVLAEMHYHADQELSDAMQAWDSQREAVVLAINSGEVQTFLTAGAALKRLGDVETRQLYRILQVRKVHNTLRIAHALRVVRLHHYNVKWEELLLKQIESGNRLIAEGAKA